MTYFIKYCFGYQMWVILSPDPPPKFMMLPVRGTEGRKRKEKEEQEAPSPLSSLLLMTTHIGPPVSPLFLNAAKAAEGMTDQWSYSTT